MARFPLVATRRRLLGAGALLGVGPRAVGIVVSADADLIAAAAAFSTLERRMQGLIEGPGCVTDDKARELLLRPLRDAQAPHLDRLCRGRAATAAGHRARAEAFLVWDAGELAELARANQFPSDRLLTAIVRDLVEVEG